MELALALTLLTVFVIGVSASTFLMLRPQRVALDRLQKSSEAERPVRRGWGIWETIKGLLTKKPSGQNWARVTKLPMSIGDASTERKMRWSLWWESNLRPTLPKRQRCSRWTALYLVSDAF